MNTLQSPAMSPYKKIAVEINGSHEKKSLDSSELTWFGRCVQKIHNADSKLAKVAIFVAAIFLAVSIIGIPLLFAYKNEVRAQDCLKKLAEKLAEKNVSIDKKVPNIEKLDLTNFFENVPVLNLKENIGNRNLKHSDLTEPVMKGVDKFNRPFIALKLTHPKEGNLVISLYQKVDGSIICIGQSGRSVFPDLIKHEVLVKLIAGEQVGGFRLVS